MNDRSVQVDASSYRMAYMSLPRLITHWHQAHEVANATPENGHVLEIGPGSGHTTWLLKNWGMHVTTLDFDQTVCPDLLGDVTRLPCKDASFDCILAAEVLEHLPFEEFGVALKELRRVSKGTVIVTLPAPLVGLSTIVNLPGLPLVEISLGIPYMKRHHFDGQHYWELGKRGFGIRRIRKVIRDAGFVIQHEFRPAPSLYCYFFVLSTQQSISR